MKYIYGHKIYGSPDRIAINLGFSSATKICTIKHKNFIQIIII